MVHSGMTLKQEIGIRKRSHAAFDKSFRDGVMTKVDGSTNTTTSTGGLAYNYIDVGKINSVQPAISA